MAVLSLNSNRVSRVMAEHMVGHIVDAYMKARVKHAPMRGPHEGYAILKEEVDELWEEVRRWQPFEHTDNYASQREAIMKEAMHVAAMSLAFLLEAVDYTP